jgi:diketogulonate reductase-like aldo/keto reductase
MKRRDFIRKAAIPPAAVAVEQTLGLLSGPERALAQATTLPAIPRRPYGSKGIHLSVVGFGAYMVAGMESERARHLVAEAVARGVNYFDVAPTYGNAEIVLGPALEPHRKGVFLACKTTERTRTGAERELKTSLERLRTDHFDLYQLHAINDLKKDVDVVFGKGGAMEVFLEAKKDGRIRHIGFSSHSVEASLAAMDRYDFDSALFPINLACWYRGNFGPQVAARAKEKGVTLLALKAMARQKWPPQDPIRKDYPKCWYQPFTDLTEADLGMRFTFSHGVTAATSPAEEKAFRLMMDVAIRLRPIAPAEEGSLKTLASTLTPIFSLA